MKLNNIVTALLFLAIGIFIGSVQKCGQKKEEPKVIEADSTKYYKLYKHQFDSIVSATKDFAHNDSIRAANIDTAIKKKYNEKNNIVNLPDSVQYALRLRLLAKLDSTKFTY